MSLSMYIHAYNGKCLIENGNSHKMNHSLSAMDRIYGCGKEWKIIK